MKITMTRIALFMAALFLAPMIVSCGRDELIKVREMKINRIDIQQVKDGRHTGSYTYGSFTYEVAVTVKKAKIASVEITKNRDTKYAKMAESVAPRIVESQRNDVDAVTGATTTSKALLKAVENALQAGMR